MKNAELLDRWVMVLFWLQIVFAVANSVSLIKLKTVEDWFGKAGICYLGSGFSIIVIAFALLDGSLDLLLPFTIVVIIVQMRGCYNECTGYEVVL